MATMSSDLLKQLREVTELPWSGQTALLALNLCQAAAKYIELLENASTDLANMIVLSENDFINTKEWDETIQKVFGIINGTISYE